MTNPKPNLQFDIVVNSNISIIKDISFQIKKVKERIEIAS